MLLMTSFSDLQVRATLFRWTNKRSPIIPRTIFGAGARLSVVPPDKVHDQSNRDQKSGECKDVRGARL